MLSANQPVAPSRVSNMGAWSLFLVSRSAQAPTNTNIRCYTEVQSVFMSTLNESSRTLSIEHGPEARLPAMRMAVHRPLLLSDHQSLN